MHLWTEYEGRTIAGSYTLGKLLRSEGRNGFFTTSNSTGDSAVIRLTEAHFDEEEVLKRWRQVAELHQSHLIEIERVGQTSVDGVALTYALMERNDANLEDVLKERPLTTAETLEVAKGVLAALTTLHASGLVHEHIEPVNVLAVGEVVKLRSDCVRECVADGEFTSEEACEELRKRDVHDFGTLLLGCLTLEKELAPATRLADPFNRLVPGAIEGTLSLRQLDAILNPVAASANGVNPGYGTASAASAGPISPVGSSANGTRPPLVPNGVRPAIAGAASGVPNATAANVTAATAATHSHTEPAMPVRARQVRETEVAPHSPFKPIWLLGAIAVLAVLLLAWHLLSGKPTAPVPIQTAPAVTAPAASAVVAKRAPANPAMAEPSATSAPVTHATATHAAGWYVVAYTYNREDQARAKAARLNRRHTGFHPEVFSPSGHAPYFISLGGPMSENEADSVQRRARRSGLPRDTFIRRY